MLKFFKSLKTLVLSFEIENQSYGSSFVPTGNESAFVHDPEMLQPLDSLSFEICFNDASAGDLRLMKEILSSWPRIRRLSFDVTVFYTHAEFLHTVSGEFFGTQLLSKNSTPAIQLLEEFRVSFNPQRDVEDPDLTEPDDVPPTGIPCAALLPQDYLLNLKVLTLDCYVWIDSASFASIVQSTPQLEQFRSYSDPGRSSCLGGLRPTDLLAICYWKRLRICRLILDVNEGDLSSPPSERKFIKLNQPEFVPRLVNRWKEELKLLELMDVSCRVIIDDKYSGYAHAEFYSVRTSLRLYLYPLVFATKCDCGTVHFHIDAQSEAAQCLGFLAPDQ